MRFASAGLQYEAYEGFEKDVKNFVTFFTPKIDEYEELLTTNRIWLERTKGVGVISGQGLHCAGSDWTGAARERREVGHSQSSALRQLQEFRFRDSYRTERRHVRPVPGAHGRDAAVVRIIEQAVAGIPEGPIMAKVPKVMKPPVGEIYHSIEAPKGELGYFIVSDGSTQPYRIRVRPPSFVNLQALDVMCRGQLVADVIAVIGTLDIVLGEVDR